MNARPDTAQAAPDAQLPAEFRSALQLAQAAVWDWQLSADHFQVDEAWIRAFGIDVPGAKQIFYGICLLLVITVLPEGVWPWLYRRLHMAEPHE